MVHQITTETPCSWSAIMRNLNVLSVHEGYRHYKGVNRWVYAFTLGKFTRKQLEWIMHFPNVEVTEHSVENMTRPDGTPLKRMFTVYLFPTYYSENTKERI